MTDFHTVGPAYIVFETTWDRPECYDTLSESTRALCVVGNERDAETMVRRIARDEYPNFDFKWVDEEYVPFDDDGWTASAGARYHIEVVQLLGVGNPWDR